MTTQTCWFCSDLSFIRKPGFELLPRLLGILDVDELLVDGRGVVKRGLPASVHAGHGRPDADRPPEVVRHVHRHHLSDTQAEVGRTSDLQTEDVRSDLLKCASRTALMK